MHPKKFIQSFTATQAILLIALLAWYVFFLAKKIDIITADLGRHITNGRILLQSGFSGAGNSVLSSNVYSYTNPDYPFLNHHWASGVIFFLVNRLAGFNGLSILFILVSVATFLIFFRMAQQRAGFSLSFALALLFIPLIADRVEIRPEVFSYFFIGLFFYILRRWSAQESSGRSLYLLPFLTLFWVNIHIYFFFGFFLMGVFLLNEIISLSDHASRAAARARIKQLAIIILLMFLAVLCNPAGISGALYPLTIFKNYGYLIVENQSIWFLERIGFVTSSFLLFKIALGIVAASFAGCIVLRRSACSFINAVLACALAAISLVAIRNFALFGLFALPISAQNIAAILPDHIRRDMEAFYSGFVFLLCIFAIGVVALVSPRIMQQYETLGIGLVPGVAQAAAFFLDHHLQGPVLNNYDIGGYLIYYLYPQERVFVDNRPEAYPNSFFTDIYVPLQENNEQWQRANTRYRFNAIFFSHRDYTPWAQAFLIARINDPEWAPVFADQYAIIFLKRNSVNASIIQQFEISKDHFGITSTQ